MNRNMHSTFFLVVIPIVVAIPMQVNSVTATSARASVAYAVADSFRFPLAVYRITGYNFGQQVGTLADGRPRYHLGEDAFATVGTEVRAVATGTVKFVKTYNSCDSNSAFGTVVVIEHQLPSGDSAGSYVYSKYEHMRGSDIKVSQGKPISKGDLIGFVGRRALRTDVGLHISTFQFIRGHTRGTFNPTATQRN